jgi:hypothetical protein
MQGMAMTRKWKIAICVLAVLAAVFLCGIGSAWAEDRFGWPRPLTVGVTFFATALLLSLLWVGYYCAGKR